MITSLLVTVAAFSLFLAMLLTSMLGAKLAQVYLYGSEVMRQFLLEHQAFIVWAVLFWVSGCHSLVMAISTLV